MMMNRIKISILLLIAVLSVIFVSCTNQETKIYNDNPVTYYVSSNNGNIDNDGSSEDSPLLTIEQVNELRLNSGDTVLFERGSVFRGNLVPVSGSEEQRITYASYGTGEMPVILGSISIFDVLNSFQKLDENIYGAPCGGDVGNIIFNDGEKYGVKKFEIYNLINPLDYCFDRSTGVFYIRVDDELEKIFLGEKSTYCSVELCATENIVELSNKHDLIFEDLAIKNGGAHGFGASSTNRVRIENCRISYIGGGFLHYNEDGKPVRYGNGVELFNSGSDIEIIGCEIFEIFDTAVTNQGKQNGGIQANITYKNNIIYNCGMSAFELWLKGRNTMMSDITFENNSVYDIGYGFSSTQGREENMGLGYFIINFGSEAEISNISIKNNSFKGIYNAHGYDALLLNMEIDTPIEDDEIYKGLSENEVEGAKYRVVYTIDGEPYFLE